MEQLTNRTFDEIEIGETLSVSRRLTRLEVETLALVSGELDPFHVDEDGGKPSPNGKNGKASAKSVGGEALLSSILCRRLPGPGTTIVEQNLRFDGAFSSADELVGTVTAREKRQQDHAIVFDCKVRSGTHDLVSGTVTVAAPTQRESHTSFAPAEPMLRRSDDFARLLKRCEGLPPVTCAVVHPCDRETLRGPLEAARRGLIIPILVGPEAKIRAVADAEKIDLSGCRIVPTEHSHAAATKAVAMARAGEVESLMKGSLHTDELMAAIVPSATGLRTARRISHVFVLDVPSYPRPLMITDAAINIAPALEDKVDIVQNAIELAQTLGVPLPKVAILAAVETVNSKMQATLDAAALCKMADRGQITGGVLDGPLAFDNAINEQAAQTKKIVSPVAGQADILLAPDLQAGNMLAKQLQYLAGADAAGIVLGTRVPIVLTSRADSVRVRLASTAVLKLVAHGRRASEEARVRGAVS
ncbi:MAG TPA: bifunctional enoyl-CoA hydratase/phosphate acetyltransferase [Polyangiaceae bacterium]|nr:bifunctional enoyl-CoA hydratase/phosphate acetyltransferase [Polyangiaceae bacterium]